MWAIFCSVRQFIHSSAPIKAIFVHLHLVKSLHNASPEQCLNSMTADQNMPPVADESMNTCISCVSKKLSLFHQERSHFVKGMLVAL